MRRFFVKVQPTNLVAGVEESSAAGVIQAVSLDRQYLRDAAGISNPVSIHRGIKGDPTRTVYADLGALTGDGSQLNTQQIKASNRPGLGASLPATASGASSIQDQLGALGI